MKPEQRMWQVLRELTHGLWNAQRHEDEFALGIPDVSFGAKHVQGWIELKQIPKWPVRPSTEVRVDHFTKQQRAWLKIRQIYGDRCWLLLKIEKTWMLFSPDMFQYVGTTNKHVLMKSANKVWASKPDPYEFLSIITKLP